MLAIIVIIILSLIFLIIGTAKGKPTNPTTRYDKTGNWMDFDIGKDETKVGNPKHPNAGIDSVMKHEFMDDITKNK